MQKAFAGLMVSCVTLGVAGAVHAAECATRSIWVANDTEGTVSKLDPRTGRETARYASVTHARVVDHVGRPFAPWSPTAQAHRPSRVGIDFYGDVWVANRAPLTQPTITKIFNDESDCIDANGNKTIQTSRDVDGDGRISITNAAEFFGEADECIAMTVAVGAQTANNFQARALAIDAGRRVEGQRNPGNVWVGMFTEQAFYQINGVDGSLMQRVPATGTISGVAPYNAAIDSQGRLWSIGGCCSSQYLIRIDTGGNPAPLTRVVAPSPGGANGVVVDLMDRIWIGGYPNPAAYRYDPTSDVWTTVTILGPPTTLATRGVGIDARGNVWAAMHTTDGTGSQVARIHANNAVSTGRFVAGGTVPVGVGVDFDGDVWTVNQYTSNASRLHIDAVSGNPAPHPTTGNIVDTFPTGPGSYTFGDFTGLSLRLVTRGTDACDLIFADGFF